MTADDERDGRRAWAMANKPSVVSLGTGSSYSLIEAVISARSHFNVVIVRISGMEA